MGRITDSQLACLGLTALLASHCFYDLGQGLSALCASVSSSVKGEQRQYLSCRWVTKLNEIMKVTRTAAGTQDEKLYNQHFSKPT